MTLRVTSAGLNFHQLLLLNAHSITAIAIESVPPFHVDVPGTLSLIILNADGIQECCGMSYSALASSLARLASPHTEVTIGTEDMVL